MTGRLERCTSIDILKLLCDAVGNKVLRSKSKFKLIQ